MRKVEVVVIGAGPAGCAAAVQCARLGLATVLVDRAGKPGGLLANAFCIENYPGTEKPLPGPLFVRRLSAWLDRFAVNVVKAEVRTVKTVDQALVVETTTGTLSARAVVLATGTTPRRASISGELETAGTTLFYEVREALRLKPSTVLVVGGGEAAFDYALSLAAAEARVRLCIRSATHRAGPRLAALVARNPEITIEYNCRIVSVRPTEVGVEATLEAGTVCHADGIVVAVGRDPSLPQLLPAPADRLVPAESVLTTIPGLFIAGDVRLTSLGQAGIAVGDGLECAARAATLIRNSGR
jgi:thioredoxin reductase (NADPH)